MRSTFRRVVSINILSLALAGGLAAQTLGTITGGVTDSTGAAVLDATVTVRNIATNGTRTVTTIRTAFIPFRRWFPEPMR